MPTVCFECGKQVDTCIEKVPHLHRYIVWCDCVAGEYQIDGSVMESSTESWESMHKYGVDRAYENWQEALFKKKNPGSETDAGVDVDAVWEAVLSAMNQAYNRGSLGFQTEREHLECILRTYLRATDDPSA